MPPPSLAEREHSDRVVAHLVHMIAEAEGWISFADYMHAVLYAPGLGYYASGARKLGVGGRLRDCARAHAAVRARARGADSRRCLRKLATGEIVEVGPGSGCLAADLLDGAGGAGCAAGALPVCSK